MPLHGYSLGAVIDSRYRLDAELGEGTFGVVYKSFQLWLGRFAALKIARHVDDARVKRFYREAHLLAQLDDPNIIKVFDAGALSDGRPYHAAELVDGAPLAAIAKRSRLNPEHACIVVSALARAVSVLHGAGVLHRDIKPENVLVPRSDDEFQYSMAKLIDLGTHGALEPGFDGFTSRVRAGRVSGTVSYMAPEQLLGRAQTVETDVFALGAVLFELLFGYPPMCKDPLVHEYHVTSAAGQFAVPVHLGRLDHEVTIPADEGVNQALRGILEVALRRNPQERFGSALAFRQALELARPRAQNGSPRTDRECERELARPSSAGDVC